MEKGVGVTDLINRIVQVLKGDLYWFKISTQDAGRRTNKTSRAIGRGVSRVTWAARDEKFGT